MKTKTEGIRLLGAVWRFDHQSSHMTLRLHWSGAHVTTTVNYVPTQALRQRLGSGQSMIANLVEKEQDNVQIRQNDFEYLQAKLNANSHTYFSSFFQLRTNIHS